MNQVKLIHTYTHKLICQHVRALPKDIHEDYESCHYLPNASEE